MKVLNLRCANGHGFEGWFGSDDEFLEQNGGGRIECPLCNDRVITRMPSAPRLNLSGASEPPPPKPDLPPAAADLQALWLRTVQQLMARTEDVGERFAEEARRIHYGESEVRAIRGMASDSEREALLEEGIEIVAIPLPGALKGPVQ